ncbi:MAG TPA: hypothetical protein VGB56_07940 [Flavisolibacter sp.]|jgi:hypothetical protein
MKNLLMLSMVIALAACSNPGSERVEQRQDLEITSPPTGTDAAGNHMDTSANDVQDSSTTVGYDSSSRRAN